MANYPSSIVSFPTHNSGDIVQPSDVNNPNAEIVAVETGLLNGTQHNVKPLTDNTYDLGDSSHAWKNLWTKGTTQFNSVAYTWPGADGSGGNVLSTNGSKTLSWVKATPGVGAIKTSDQSTTSGTYVDVTSLSVTLTTRGGTVIIIATVPVKVSASTAQLTINADTVDGNTLGVCGATIDTMVTVMQIATPAAGSHTYKLRAKIADGASTLSMNASSVANANIVAFEVNA